MVWASLFYTLKDETTAPFDKNKVAKKASALTANGDPQRRDVVYLGAWLF